MLAVTTTPDERLTPVRRAKLAYIYPIFAKILPIFRVFGGILAENGGNAGVCPWVSFVVP